MIAYKLPHLLVFSIVISYLPLKADDQVTIYPPPAPVAPSPNSDAATAAQASSVSYANSPSAAAASMSLPTAANTLSTPEVETILPIARHITSGTVSVNGVNSVVGNGTESAMLLPGSRPLVENNYGVVAPPVTTAVRFKPGEDPLLSGNSWHKPKITYPWKEDIITTVFWIGEGGCAISSTDNVASAWDEDWRHSYRGTDSPNDRDVHGLLPKNHAATCNPFYVALPFNDLADPEKARQWLPPGWYVPPKYGQRPVSACKDRWVEIKFNGATCYAQWEDVGPLTSDHAEYVFGPERPTTYTRAGLDVSPAVAEYLHLDQDHKNITSWRFVDAEDVPPGQWLKLGEAAIILTADLMQHAKNKPLPQLPIQKASQPVDDPTSTDNAQRKIAAAKG